MNNSVRGIYSKTAKILTFTINKDLFSFDEIFRKYWRTESMTYTTAISLAQYQAHIGLRLCKIPTVAYWQLLLCPDCWQPDIAKVNNTYLLLRTFVPNLVLTSASPTARCQLSLCLSIRLFPVNFFACPYGPGLPTYLFTFLWRIFLLVSFLLLTPWAPFSTSVSECLLPMSDHIFSEYF